MSREKNATFYMTNLVMIGLVRYTECKLKDTKEEDSKKRQRRIH